MTYQNAMKLYPNDSIERKKHLKLLFRKTMSMFRIWGKTDELNIQKESMTYVFEHIKPKIIKLLSFYVPPEEKEYVSKENWVDIKYRKKIFDILIDLEDKSMLFWMFFHFNYFYLENVDQQRKILMENIEIFYKYYPKSMFFNSIKELYGLCSQCNVLFSISYQNRNNKIILENYCKLLRKICPDLNYTSSFIDNNPNFNSNNRNSNSKIKVAFFSEYLTSDSSVLRDRIGIITQLPKDKFDIYYLAFTNPENIKGQISKTLYNMFKSNYIRLPDDLVDARKYIELQKFDIIVYCEIGMMMRPLYLSYSRLAPIQITTWGHSETSGISTIDYFVSSKYFEIEESRAQTHYSEKLYLMNSLSTYYYPPTKMLLPNNHVFKKRSEYGLNDKMTIYGCIQSSFKISEEFEKILDGILRADTNAVILMSTNKPFCKSQITRMLKLMGEKNLKRLIFFPALNISNYMNLIRLTDVILDPYPFGGCNTSFEAFDFNIPVVTMPTKYLNGRFTFGMYKKMGFIDMIADSPQNYIKIAIKAGTDKKWRDTVKEKINRTKVLIFQDKESISDWAKMLYDLYHKNIELKEKEKEKDREVIDQSSKKENFVHELLNQKIIINEEEYIKNDTTKSISPTQELNNNHNNLEITNNNIVSSETINGNNSTSLEELMSQNENNSTSLEEIMSQNGNNSTSLEELSNITFENNKINEQNFDSEIENLLNNN